MNWRRGLLMAGIHLVIATGSFVHDEVNYWPLIRSTALRSEGAHMRLAAFQEQGFPDNVCDFGIYDSGPSPLANVASAANLPLTLASGWHSPCMPQPQRTRITKGMEAIFGGNTHRAEVAADICLCIGVLFQWVLIGGMPLIRPRRWWLEPAMLVTFCAILAASLAITPLHEFSRIGMVVIALLWLWWFALLLWKPVYLAWQSTLHGLQRLS